MMDIETLIRTAGIIGVIGTMIYGLGDVLLLAPSIGPTRKNLEPKLDLTPYPSLAGRENIIHVMASMPWKRLMWGGLISLLAAPMTLGGYVLIYAGLDPSGFLMALIPTLLFITAVISGPFVHGSFIYLAENVQGFLNANEEIKPIFIERLSRQEEVMKVGYIVILALNIIGSIWFSFVVAFGGTAFPAWMAAVNPVTLTIGWILLKKALPDPWLAFTDGAGFNIAYFVFFALMTYFLW